MLPTALGVIILLTQSVLSMIGFININKQSGVSSANVVYKIKKFLKVKCGHMGTLDPLAEGVLPIGLNQATRLFDILLDKEKSYLAEFDFSFTTPSLDLETEECARSRFIPSIDDIKSVLPALTGDVDQIPPSYSAKFVDGRRSYKLARRGVDVDLPPKRVNIAALTVEKQLSHSKFLFKIDCSAGTYIRAIVRDIAGALGVCGVMTKLTRTRSGNFTIENSFTLDEFLSSENYLDYIVKPQDAVTLPEIFLDETSATRLLNGLKDEFDFADGTYKVFNGDTFWGIGKVESGFIKMKAYVRDL